MRRFFYRGVPATYMEKIVNEVVPKLGVDFVEHKDIYRIKVVLLLNNTVFMTKFLLSIT